MMCPQSASEQEVAHDPLTSASHMDWEFGARYKHFLGRIPLLSRIIRKGSSADEH